MEFVNLTPHDIIVKDPKTEIITIFPTSGMVARVEQSRITASKVGGFTLEVLKSDKIIGFPKYIEPDTRYIVSSITYIGIPEAEPFWKRVCLCPNTSSFFVERNDRGQILTVPGFCIPG